MDRKLKNNDINVAFVKITMSLKEESLAYFKFFLDSS